MSPDFGWDVTDLCVTRAVVVRARMDPGCGAVETELGGVVGDVGPGQWPGSGDGCPMEKPEGHGQWCSVEWGKGKEKGTKIWG